MITPAVDAAARSLGLPGMAVLQFGFGAGDPTERAPPRNHAEDVVVYTGTHDNDTRARLVRRARRRSVRAEVDDAIAAARRARARRRTGR